MQIPPEYHPEQVHKEVLQYFFLVFQVTYSIGIITFAVGDLENFPLGKISILVPATVAIILQFRGRKKRVSKNIMGLRVGRWKFWLIAPLTVALIEGTVYICIYFLDPAVFLSPPEVYERIKRAEFIKNLSASSAAFSLIINSVITTTFKLLLLLGEELGWRGYLMPRLLRIYSFKKAFLIGGMAWGIWHFFEIIFASNYCENLFLGNTLMILFCIPAGIIFQYLYLKSESIFVTVLCLGTFNWTTTTAMNYLIDSEKINQALYGPTGLIAVLVWWVFGIVFYSQFKMAYRKKQLF